MTWLAVAAVLAALCAGAAAGIVYEILRPGGSADRGAVMAGKNLEIRRLRTRQFRLLALLTGCDGRPDNSPDSAAELLELLEAIAFDRRLAQLEDPTPRGSRIRPSDW